MYIFSWMIQSDKKSQRTIPVSGKKNGSSVCMYIQMCVIFNFDSFQHLNTIYHLLALTVD